MNLQLLISGVSLGAVYALIAVGFAIVFSVLKFSNFAHGGMISLCAYVGYFFQAAFENPPPFYVTVLFTALCGMAIALLIDSLAYRQIRKNKSPGIYYFLASVAFAIIIEQILNITLGKNAKGYPNVFENMTFNVGSVSFNSMNVMIMLVSLVLLAVLVLVLNKTKIGLAIRAVAINSDTSRLMGINSGVIITVIFLIAGFLAGVSGVLLGAKYNVTASLGSSMMTKGFIASIIGGLGSLSGAIVAAVGLGVLEMIITYYFGGLSTPVFVFVIVIAFLIIRPQGIAGKFAKDKV